MTRINTMKNIDPNFLSQTKKDRRIEIRNLPLYLGLTKDDLKEIVVDYILKHALNDTGNKQPVLLIELNSEQKSAIVELSSIEETHRMAKLDFIEIVGVRCKLIRCAETLYGQESTMVNRIQTAQVV